MWLSPALSRLGCSKMKGMPSSPFPEIDRGLAIGADERDVMHALGLKLFHPRSSFHAFATSFDLYSLRGKLPSGASAMSVVTTSLSRSPRLDALGQPGRVGAARDLDGHRQRRLLSYAALRAVGSE